MACETGMEIAMKALLLSTSLLLLASGAVAEELRHTNVIMPEAVKWMENPAFPKGIQIATLVGDPAKPGETVVQRIKFPPIAELGFCGIATGAAMAGLRPVVDISTATFSYEAIPQIVNEAAIAYSNSGGQTNVPVTYFMRYGIRFAILCESAGPDIQIR